MIRWVSWLLKRIPNKEPGVLQKASSIEDKNEAERLARSAVFMFIGASILILIRLPFVFIGIAFKLVGLALSKVDDLLEWVLGSFLGFTYLTKKLNDKLAVQNKKLEALKKKLGIPNG